MRLGSQLCHLIEGTKVHEMYGNAEIYERHRHRYEVNNNLRDQIEAAGLKVSGLSTDKRLVEVVEIPIILGCGANSTLSSHQLLGMDTHYSLVSLLRQENTRKKITNF